MVTLKVERQTMSKEIDNVISEEEIQRGLKSLNDVDVAEDKGLSSPIAKDEKTVFNLEDLYTKYNGDIQAIFDELGESARKALKYPPKDAAEFASKYYEGYYDDLKAKLK